MRPLKNLLAVVMTRLAIIGAGGHAKVVADSAELSGWEHIELFDDHLFQQEVNYAWPITGKLSDVYSRAKEFDGVIVAIGNNAIRLKFSLELLERGLNLITVIHPSAVLSRHATIEPGSVLFAGSVVNPGAKIGMATIINTAATIDHDCILGAGVHVSPGAHLAGGVEVGAQSWIGIGAVVRQQIIIGSDVIVGAGAAVVKNIPMQRTVAGVPAVDLRN